MKQSGFRYKIRENSLRKVVAQNNREVIFPKVLALKSIACIGEFPVNSALLKKFFEQATQLTVLEISSEKRPKGEVSSIIYMSDLNFWGLPPAKLFNEFVESRFDMLINFAPDSNQVIDYICAQSAAKFKVSKYALSTVYDLIVKVPGLNNDIFLEELKKTLNNFNH